MQPPQAPSTPVVAQQALNELVKYYRELANFHRSSVNYHQQLLEQHVLEAEAAEKQLASIEAILHPLTTELTGQEINSNANTSIGYGEISSPTLSVNGKQVNGTAVVTPSEDKSELTTVEPEPEESNLTEATTEVTKSEPKTSSVSKGSTKNNGKTKSVQTTRRRKQSEPAESLIPKETPPEQVSSSTKKVARTSQVSEPSSSRATSKTKKPTKNKKTSKTKKTTKAYSSRLPYSDKLASRATIVDAVAFCLQEYYPKVISAEDIVKYYYPEGLEGETYKRAYAAFSNCLSKGSGKQGWIRASIGKYRWKDES